MRDRDATLDDAPGPRITLVLEDAHTLYRWALQNARLGRQVSVSFLSDPEIAVAVALGKKDAAAGRARSRVALAASIERALARRIGRGEAERAGRLFPATFAGRWRRTYRERSSPRG